ncbi:MAG: hemolysin [Alteromonadaceae bacterium]|nr:hemolysin [Alteromonadaceae bacterium]
MTESFAAAPYVRDKPRISYVEPNDPWVTQKLVSSLEVMFGRRKIEAIYNELKSQTFNIETFFANALVRANITPKYNASQLAKIPKTGPVMFLANHPFGVVDGIILCDLAVKTRGDFRIMLNSLLCQDRDLAPYFLPVDFANNKQAIKTNIKSKRCAQHFLKEEVPVLIFPSGMVSTADRFGFGAIEDGPWSTFAAKLINDAKPTVIPVHFYGSNSRKFHVASHIAEPLRMALLVHEALNKFNDDIELDIGDPITWEQMAHCNGRQELTEFLYQKVQDTGIRKQQ